jgi:large subunit ribosomal protein L18
MQVKNKNSRHKRKIRIRKKINGLETKPRLAIYKSNKNIYVQAIDDLNHKTIATSSSLSKDLKTENLSLETAKKVGELMGDKLKELGISEAVFDRGGYIYHGRVKALADAIREKGIKF